MVRVMQKLGEPVRSYMWRVEEDMRMEYGGDDFPESSLIRNIYNGILPRLKAVFPPFLCPMTRKSILEFGDRLVEFLPDCDLFWHHEADFANNSRGKIVDPKLVPECAQQLPRKQVVSSVVTVPAKVSNPVNCYKCGQSGHFARFCTNKRINALKKHNRIRNMKKMQARGRK